MPTLDNNYNVPTLKNLVAAGNPNKKARAKQKNEKSSHLDDLNQRIDEIENAIGQDTSGPVGRAFAIRAEKTGVTKAIPKFKENLEQEKI